ncbi:hypothetical protein J6W78_10100 [bacterium]|nr:hypothetical protein [bacterium]
MLVGNGYSILVISPSNISNELTITKNVLNKWNKKYSNDRKKFLFLDVDSGELNDRNTERLENADLVIGIFFDEPDDSTKNKIKNEIEKRKEYPTLLYFINSNSLPTGLDDPKICRLCSKEEFEFFLTCDICAIDDFNNDASMKCGVINISVFVENSEKQDQKTEFAKVTYFISSFFYSPEKPVTFRANVRVNPDKSFEKLIDFQHFEPPVKVLNDRNASYKEYEIKDTAHNSDELFFTGEIITWQKLWRNDSSKGGISFTFPYYANYFIINIDISQAKFIRDYHCVPKLYNNKNRELNLVYFFNEDSYIYTMQIPKAEAGSNMAFEWEKKQENKK